MALTFDPFSQLDRFAASVLDSVRAPRLMPVDLYRDGDRYILHADLPGVDPGSIDVDLDGGQLTLRAQRTADSREGVRWLARERGAGSFPATVLARRGRRPRRHQRLVRQRRALGDHSP